MNITITAINVEEKKNPLVLLIFIFFTYRLLPSTLKCFSSHSPSTVILNHFVVLMVHSIHILSDSHHNYSQLIAVRGIFIRKLHRRPKKINNLFQNCHQLKKVKNHCPGKYSILRNLIVSISETLSLYYYCYHCNI